MRYLQTYTVQSELGKAFPLEMLQADSAFPMNPSDIREVEDSQIQFRRFTVQLGRYVRSRKDQPLCRRWESHGWAVLESQTR